MDSRRIAPPRASVHWDPLTLWARVLDLPREQFVASTHVASAVFSGMEALGKVQQNAMRQFLRHCAAATQKLHGRYAPVDLLAVQMELARHGVEDVSGYCQQVANAVLQTQARVAACGWELVEADQVMEACAVFNGA